MASWAKALALAGGQPGKARMLAEELRMHERVKGVIKAPVPAHWTGDSDVEGLADARFISTQFQPFLRSSSLFYRALDDGIVRVGLRERVGWTTATATGFVAGEGAAVPVSRMEVEASGVDRLKANALIVLTRDMLRTAGTSGEALISRELRRAVSRVVDEQFLELALDDVSPLPSNGTDAEAAANDLADLLAAVQPTSESRLLIGMAPDVGRAAATLTTAAGGFLFPDMTPTGGNIRGIDAIVTDALDIGQMALIDASGIAGDSELITVEASDDTTIEMATDPDNDSSDGTASEMVSMFQTHSVAILATAWFGALRFRDDAAAIMDGIAWGNAGGEGGE